MAFWGNDEELPQRLLQYSTVHPCISKSLFFVSSKKYQSIWGRKWKVLLRIACKKWSQIHHTTSRRCLNRAHK